tara:strand:- start:7 stop:489 length:483 start_codon:yes stop_codon:yes gene_type:complete
MAYASGKNAYGISDRSGFRYRLRDMKKEWNGLLVGPDEFEPKHPQIMVSRHAADPQALRNARPEPDIEAERVIQYGFNPVGYSDYNNLIPNNLVVIANVGTVIAFGVGDPSSSTDYVALSGFSTTGSISSVTIIDDSSTDSKFDSTSVTLDSTTKTFDEG